MEVKYNIELDGEIIGTSLLEKSDAPMGVVFGIINFQNINSGYSFFKKYCLSNNVTINTDDEAEKFIDTQVIPGLKIFNQTGKEIKGVGNHICGFDNEGFEITSLGIPSEEFEKQFPIHHKEYYGK